jgi:REP element-mobilizing transposase RayT
MLFHVLNRGVARMKIFRAEKDYDAFRRVMEQTLRDAPIRICAYCWLPNHWHFVLWRERDGDLSTFMQRMANMHTQRWQRAKLRVGYGHLYQGRFKSFPLESDEKTTNCVVKLHNISTRQLRSDRDAADEYLDAGRCRDRAGNLDGDPRVGTDPGG